MIKVLKIFVKIIMVAVICAGLYYFATAPVPQGTYDGFGQDDSTYQVKISGREISVVDIGAGNPILKGKIYVLRAKQMAVLNCLDDTDFAGQVIGLEHKICTVNIYKAGDLLYFHNNVYRMAQSEEE